MVKYVFPNFPFCHYVVISVTSLSLPKDFYCLPALTFHEMFTAGLIKVHVVFGNNRVKKKT